MKSNNKRGKNNTHNPRKYTTSASSKKNMY